MVHGLDIVEELTVDHRAVEALLEQIQVLPRGDARRKHRMDDLTIVLVAHATAEEEYLYPAVRDFVAGGGAVADKEIADHHRVEGLLKDLEHWQAHEPQFEDLVERLGAEVTSHIREEENVLFPALREACTLEVLGDLGGKVRRAKAAAPTRPHPTAPGAPNVKKLLAPVAGLVDRIRDIISGRGRQV